MDILELVVALVVILAGAQLFTNGVEWIGEGFGLSEGAVGSVLAAIGTALPETVLPFVAILTGHGAGKDIGVGAILGAPFMLSTLAMALLGSSVLVFSMGDRRPSVLRPEKHVVEQDLGFFLVMYALAVVAGLWHVKVFRWVLAGGLILAYGFYVRLHFRSPGEKEIEIEAVGEIRSLYLRGLLKALFGRRRHWPARPPVWASIAQTVVALGLIVGGAKLFVDGIQTLSRSLGIPDLPFALLVAPVATELPELFNSVIWIRRQKDTLAFGNVTGAMVFQSTFPVAIGLLFTQWRLSGDALVAALVALGAATVVWATMRIRGHLGEKFLAAHAVLFVAYVIYVVVRL